MRVSTSMIYQTGVATMQRQAAQQLQTQQQVATGRRILNPSDDPIGAARALELTQSQAVNAQFIRIQGYADDNLRTIDGQLAGAVEVLQYLRERAVQAGGVLTQNDLTNMAKDVRSQFDALRGIANSEDSNGDYVFAGYKSQTQPFPGAVGAVTYAGDQGVRTMQVAPSRYMPVSLPGSEVFGSNRVAGDAVTVGAHGGSGSLRFTGGAPNAANTGVRYEIVATANPEVFTVTRLRPGLPGDAVTPIYTPGPPATLTVDDVGGVGGMVFSIDGPPADGETFEVFVASQSVFENVAVFIDALERPGAGGMAGGAVAFAVQTLDAALTSVSRARSQVGSQRVELENLRNVGSDIQLQYAQTLSRIQDVDMAEAISRLTQQQTALEASQASFVRVTGLSLFNYIN